MTLEELAAAMADALRPWVATDVEATDTANNIAAALVLDTELDVFEIAYGSLLYRHRTGFIHCGDLEAAANCFATRWHLEIARAA